MRSNLERFGLMTGLLLTALPLAAHHSRALYDRERIVTLEGVVTKYEWANPHVYLYVETQSDSGDAVEWALESNVTTIMRRRGWSRDTFAPGDRVTARGNVQSHDGAAATYQGHSIGRWEDEALVVDTTHFFDHRSGNARGIPSGSQKHLVERFELNPDGASLTYRFELEDPEYLTSPVTGELQSVYRPDLEFVPIACDLENARRFVGD